MSSPDADGGDSMQRSFEATLNLLPVGCFRGSYGRLAILIPRMQ